jgi:hypothetical protein
MNNIFVLLHCPQVTPSTTDAEISRYRTEFEACAIACCDRNVAKLPTISKRVIEMLKSGRY